MTITPVDHEPTRFWVDSQSTPGVTHLVDLDDNGKPGCSCHDFMCREKECKHIRAVLEVTPQKKTRIVVALWFCSVMLQSFAGGGSNT